ncbi:MAG TPA: hypothetical protein VF669_06715 [Tepidisphaeraceae bacterium]|jgi:hypothetical protein
MPAAHRKFRPRSRPRPHRADRRDLDVLVPPGNTPTPASANVLSVTATFGDDFAIFIFDQPLVIEAGAEFDMFYLSENTGLSTLTGTAGELLDGQHLKITFDGNIVDSGEGWTWTISPQPEKIYTASGGNLLEGAGAVMF